MTFGDIVTAATGALLDVIPAADILLIVVAGSALGIAARFGRRVLTLGR